MVCALVLLACSPTPTNECVAYTVSSNTDLQSPVVSFRNDVVPIFVQSCAFSQCHGTAGGGNNGIFLGSKTSTFDPGAVRSALVGVPSTELPTMLFVTSSDPFKSYLMHKMDSDLCTLHAQCTGGTCGQSMPKDNATLAPSVRDVIRRWIAQGAKDG